jgi:hypothetical protein
MKWPRGSSVPGLLLVLLLGVSCTTGDSAPTEIPSAPSEAVARPPIVASTAELLVCEPQQYTVAKQTIGPDGGSLTIGRHRLEIPRGALASKVTITGEQVSDSVNSVRLSPDGLRFAKPARLTLSYRNCTSAASPKRVAYTSELLELRELPPSEDYPKYEYVTGAIGHFSRYAVAY